MADTDFVKEATLTAENTFTAWLEADQIRVTHQGSARDFADFSVDGTWQGTLTIQRRFKNSLATVRDVDTIIHDGSNASRAQLSPSKDPKFAPKLLPENVTRLVASNSGSTHVEPVTRALQNASSPKVHGWKTPSGSSYGPPKIGSRH